MVPLGGLSGFWFAKVVPGFRSAKFLPGSRSAHRFRSAKVLPGFRSATRFRQRFCPERRGSVKQKYLSVEGVSNCFMISHGTCRFYLSDRQTLYIHRQGWDEDASELG